MTAWCGNPLETILAVLSTSNLNISAPNGHNYLQWAATPDHSAEKFKEGRRALKAVKTI